MGQWTKSRLVVEAGVLVALVAVVLLLKTIARGRENASGVMQGGDALVSATVGLGPMSSVSDLKRATAENPRDPRLAGWLAQALIKADSPAEALAESERGLSLHPRRMELLGARADALFALRRFRDAAEAYDAVIAMRPSGWSEPWFRKAEALEAAGDSEAAALAYRETLAVDPTRRDAQAALDRHEKLVRESPPETGTALSQIRQGDLAAAEVSLALARQRDPGDVETLKWSAYVSLQTRRYEDALRYVDAAGNQGDPNVLADFRCEALMGLERNEESLQCWERAIATKPRGWWRPWLAKAEVLERLGRPDEARKTLEELLKMYPGSVDAKRELLRLSKRRAGGAGQ